MSIKQATAGIGEKTFTGTAPGWPLPAAGGLVCTVAPGADPPEALRLATTADGWTVWVGCDADAPATALAVAVAVAVQQGIRAVCLAGKGADPGAVQIGLDFALHLRSLRGPFGGRTRAFTVSPAPPAPLPGVVRLPHLIAVNHDHQLHDEVMWELLPTYLVPQWLGRPLPDLVITDTHIAALMRLRGLARYGQLPTTPAGRALAGLLRDRYLSIKLVYQHPDLFRTLIADLEGRESS